VLSVFVIMQVVSRKIAHVNNVTRS
jgi:hypothetical protein